MEWVMVSLRDGMYANRYYGALSELLAMRQSFPQLCRNELRENGFRISTLKEIYYKAKKYVSSPLDGAFSTPLARNMQNSK